MNFKCTILLFLGFIFLCGCATEDAVKSPTKADAERQLLRSLDATFNNNEKDSIRKQSIIKEIATSYQCTNTGDIFQSSPKALDYKGNCSFMYGKILQNLDNGDYLVLVLGELLIEDVIKPYNPLTKYITFIKNTDGVVVETTTSRAFLLHNNEIKLNGVGSNCLQDGSEDDSTPACYMIHLKEYPKKDLVDDESIVYLYVQNTGTDYVLDEVNSNPSSTPNKIFVKDYVSLLTLNSDFNVVSIDALTIKDTKKVSVVEKSDAKLESQEDAKEKQDSSVEEPDFLPKNNVASVKPVETAVTKVAPLVVPSVTSKSTTPSKATATPKKATASKSTSKKSPVKAKSSAKKSAVKGKSTAKKSPVKTKAKAKKKAPAKGKSTAKKGTDKKKKANN